MVVALIACLAVTTLSGLELYAIEENAGPLAMQTDVGRVAPALPALVATAYTDDDDDHAGDREQAEEFWEEIHEVAANLALFLVLLHGQLDLFQLPVDLLDALGQFLDPVHRELLRPRVVGPVGVQLGLRFLAFALEFAAPIPVGCEGVVVAAWHAISSLMREASR